MSDEYRSHHRAKCSNNEKALSFGWRGRHLSSDTLETFVGGMSSDASHSLMALCSAGEQRWRCGVGEAVIQDLYSQIPREVNGKLI